jgi:hypothetical protein
MRDAGTDHIIECASQRRKTTYGDLWEAIGRSVGIEIGKHWRQLPVLLGYIGEVSYKETGLVLTALVIHQEGDEHPGGGFFRLAANLGALPEKDAPPMGVRWEEMTEAQRVFWNLQVESLYARFGESDRFVAS